VVVVLPDQDSFTISPGRLVNSSWACNIVRTLSTLLYRVDLSLCVCVWPTF